MTHCADELARRLDVAAGRAQPDLVLRGGNIANVFTGAMEPGTLLLSGRHIAAVLPSDAHIPTAGAVVDLGGAIVAPSLIDAHMHIESTLLMPAALAQVVVPRGTGMVIADPHEIGNVLGVRGVEIMLAASEGLSLDCAFMAPSCVPASPFERAGATLGAEEIRALFRHERVIGLAEMMNFPGVLAGDPGVVERIAAAHAAGLRVDGHAPGVRGQDLVRYAGAGITSDHECTDPAEALERDRLGMLVQVREGSMARNLDAMIPLIRDGLLRNWCLCTDDILPGDLLKDGHLDGLLRRLVEGGVDPVTAIRHATLVPARHYGIAAGKGWSAAMRGAVAPGYLACLAVFADTTSFACVMTVHNGRIVARDGRMVTDVPLPVAETGNTVRVGSIDESAFRVRVTDPVHPVIGVDPVQITTTRIDRAVLSSDGWFRFTPAEDVAMVACVQRHRGDGTLGVGLAQGFGFRTDGAIATSVGHDAHNLMIAGTNGPDMLACVHAIAELGGGMVVVRGGEVKAALPLPVAGLMSSAPAAEVLQDQQKAEAAAAALGITLPSPFGTLSFLPLSVIPELRITDQGLFDVTKWALVGSRE